MIQKLLGAALAALLVVIAVLVTQLQGANADRANLTSERDTAKQAASNALQAQQEAEGQSRQWAARFDSLDAALKALGTTQKANNDDLAIRLKNLSKIQKTEGDTDATIQCLDLPVPFELDRGLRDDNPSADGDH